jgi:hypothetical protein
MSAFQNWTYNRNKNYYFMNSPFEDRRQAAQLTAQLAVPSTWLYI